MVQWVKNPTAEARVQSLAQELPNAECVAIKLKQKKKTLDCYYKYLFRESPGGSAG